jgi:hypothetical protein
MNTKRNFATTDTTIRQQLANATSTYYGCSGHGKAARNKERMERFQKELDELVPMEELLAEGVFNGPGSC